MNPADAVIHDGSRGGMPPRDPRSRELRNTLGRFATGVTVVTTSHHGSVVGVTVNSFTSVSLEPPMILWCLRRESVRGTVFTASRHFAVNVLADGQQPVASLFTRPGGSVDKVPIHPGPHDLPILTGVVAVIICRRDRILPVGDHLVIFGAVLDHWAEPGPVLLFHDSRYRTSAINPDLLRSIASG